MLVFPRGFQAFSNSFSMASSGYLVTRIFVLGHFRSTPPSTSKNAILSHPRDGVISVKRRACAIVYRKRSSTSQRTSSGQQALIAQTARLKSVSVSPTTGSGRLCPGAVQSGLRASPSHRGRQSCRILWDFARAAVLEFMSVIFHIFISSCRGYRLLFLSPENKRWMASSEYSTTRITVLGFFLSSPPRSNRDNLSHSSPGITLAARSALIT